MQIHGALLALHTGPAGEDGLQPRGIVRRPRPPPPGADLVRAPRDARGQARLRPRCGSCSTAAPTRRARPRSCSNAAVVRLRAYRVANALIESTSSTRTTRRAARCAASARCRLLRARGADGQARRRAGIDPVELRLLNALEPGDTLPTGQTITGSLPVAEVIRRAAALPVPEPRSCRAIRSAFPAAPATRPAARACSAASASRSASRTSATPRASTTTCAARVRLCRRGRSSRRGPLRRGGGRPGRDGRDPPGRAYRARHGRGLARARLDRRRSTRRAPPRLRA